jgi:hypothetical protein
MGTVWGNHSLPLRKIFRLVEQVQGAQAATGIIRCRCGKFFAVGRWYRSSFEQGAPASLRGEEAAEEAGNSPEGHLREADRP